MSKFNLSDIIESAKIRTMMDKTKEELAKIEVTGEAGAGAVVVCMNAQHMIKSVTIDDSALQDAISSGKEILEDLVISACNNANKKVDEATKAKISNVSSILDMFGKNDE